MLSIMRSIELSNKSNSFDWMRGLAVLFVLFAHLDNYRILFVIWPYSHNSIQSLIGKVGVYLFFIISGFLVWNSLEKSMQYPKGLTRYFINRITRIYPLYLICILLISLMSSLFIGYKQPIVNTQVIIRHIFFLQSFTPDISQVFNGPFWTLSYEFLFYLIAPVVYYFKPSNKTLVLSILVTQLAWAFFSVTFNPFVNYWALFAVGILMTKTRLTIKPFYSLAIVLVGFIGIFIYPKIWIIRMFLAFGLFNFFLNFDFKKPIFSPIVGLGVISYSVYVWHYPIIHLIPPYVRNVHMLIPPIKLYLPYGFLFEGLLIVVFIIVFSWLSYRFIEKPAMTRLRNYLLATQLKS